MLCFLFCYVSLLCSVLLSRSVLCRVLFRYVILFRFNKKVCTYTFIYNRYGRKKKFSS